MQKKTPLSGREDGQLTKERIIEHAGRLFALRGYDKTTSKDICQAAGVNSAAVNYHFGSREHLYEAVLDEVQGYLINLSSLRTIAGSDAAPKDKLIAVADFFLTHALHDGDWHLKLWARELLEPSPMMRRLFISSALPKLSIILRLLQEYLGYAADNPKLYICYITLLSPFAFTAIMQDSPMLAHAPVTMSRATYIALLRDAFICQLDAFKAAADDNADTLYQTSM